MQGDCSENRGYHTHPTSQQGSTWQNDMGIQMMWLSNLKGGSCYVSAAPCMIVMDITQYLYNKVVTTSVKGN